MENLNFLSACHQLMGVERSRDSIGTMGEKTLHAVLKQYYEPRREYQEISVGPFVADIFNPNGIIEIQTRGLFRLKRKLEFFLEQCPVTVVYPVASTKWLIWIEEDGIATKRRRSPKRPGAWEVLWELDGISSFLMHENFRLRVPLLELEEYRLKNGWSADKKRGSTRYDRMPIALEGEITVNCPRDFHLLLPPALPETFTAKEFGKAAGISSSKAGSAVRVLYLTGVAERVGKKRNAYLYTVKK